MIGLKLSGSKIEGLLFKSRRHFGMRVWGTVGSGRSV
jgi:hypothetical protein